MDEKLKRYAREYINDEGHWYISKVKQFTEESINNMAKGLELFYQLLSTKPNKALKLRYQNFYQSQQQKSFFDVIPKRIMVVDSSKLFLSLEILKLGLVDLQQMKKKNPQKHEKVLQIIQDFKNNKEYSYFTNKYSNKFLNSEIAIYFRNYKSWLSKFGFFGVYKNNFFFETEAGKAFRQSHQQIKLSNAIFLNQIKKLQVWNPTIDKKYQNIKVVPYYLILQVLKALPNHAFTKTEYILFVTKIKSHQKRSIENAVDLILAFRKLTPEEQKRYIENIKTKDKKKYKTRTRTNYERLYDSSTKEISAYTFGSLTMQEHENKDIVIKIKDIAKVNSEINAFLKTPMYLDFQSQNEWIRYLGNLKGLTVDDLIELYVVRGNSEETIQKKLPKTSSEIKKKIKDRLLEKEIEEYYIENLYEINNDLEVVEEPYGRQYATQIGYIDLLCYDKRLKAYVVIEFKRSQVSDQTIGQILRYMGWVYLNLAKANDKVYGVIVGNSFSEKLDHAFIGIQSEHIYDLIELFEHPFSEKNKPKNK